MLNRLIHSITLTIIIFSFFSCQPTEKVIHKQTFFSLTEYFEGQIKLLGDQNYHLEKSVLINEQSEKKTITEPNYETELAAFIANDINRPAWKDKYATDSLFKEGYLAGIRYTAKDASLHTREINIEFKENGEVEVISLEEASHSALSDTEKEMSYLALQNYHIKSIEANKAGDSVTVEVSGLLSKVNQ